jgi:hypothetical protein
VESAALAVFLFKLELLSRQLETEKRETHSTKKYQEKGLKYSTIGLKVRGRNWTVEVKLEVW